jgi:chromosomal replication initiation ATPase DnaA
MCALQLLLDLASDDRMGRDDFLPGATNAAALSAVDGWQRWPSGRMLICGPAGSGRTHLAALWAGEARARRLSGHTLKRPDWAPAYAVDDADGVAGGPDREEALFHLLNRAEADGAALLMTAQDTPGTWGLALPDLESRLLACPVARLDRPDDALLRMTLVKLCDERQLAIDEATLEFLLARMDRSLSFARRVVAALDHAALRLRKRVTRTMAADILATLQGPAPCR